MSNEVGHFGTLDVEGIECDTEEWAMVESQELKVVKNVNCGVDIDTPEAKGYSFWKNEQWIYSVVVPNEYAFVKLTKPDLSDGGYQHPESDDMLHTIAMKVAGTRKSANGRYIIQNYEAVWNNPRHGQGLRYAFKTRKHAEAFLVEIKKYYKI